MSGILMAFFSGQTITIRPVLGASSSGVPSDYAIGG
jgi:hypothetical protein